MNGWRSVRRIALALAAAVGAISAVGAAYWALDARYARAADLETHKTGHVAEAAATNAKIDQLELTVRIAQLETRLGAVHAELFDRMHPPDGRRPGLDELRRADTLLNEETQLRAMLDVLRRRQNGGPR